MGNSIGRKWRAMGISGLILATVLPFLFFISALSYQNSDIFRPMFDMNPCLLCIMIVFYEQEYTLLDYWFYVLWCLQIIQSSNRSLAVTRFTFWTGISLAVVAGTLILVGWIQFGRLRSKK